jgi:DNA-binding IclR family transcriptional regulator
VPKTSRTASSADNVLRLVCLLSARGVLRVSEVSAELDVAVSTAHRLLTVLLNQGFAVQESRNGPYLPGPALRELATAALNPLDLRRAARPFLEALTMSTRETVSIGVLEERNVRFIDGIEGDQTVRVGNRIGVLIPAHCTAAGKAMLAALPEVEFERRYAGRELERRTANSPDDQGKLLRELAEVRKTGFAMNVEEGESGVCAVGAAVRDSSGAPVAAVNVVLPSIRMPTKHVTEKIAEVVMKAAAGVAAAIHTH